MIDIGLEKFFGSGKDEIYYGDVQVETAAYQDDILKASSAQAGMTRLAGFLEERGLDAHPDQTCYLVCGTHSTEEG